MDGDGWVYSDGGRQRFNATILKEYGYVIYPNNTISNFSNCFLAFGGYIPTVISNGSWYNSSGCDTPVRQIRTRGIVGIVSAVIFAIILVLSLVALNKHGKSFLPAEKRFRLVGRRWPWYWCIITASVGLVSGFTAVDVDRVWVLGTAAIFHFIFYLVTLPTCLSAIWEMTRNWASFEERKGVDEDFTMYRQDDLRSRIEFYEPLIFYLFNFLSFFLSILRAWNPIARSNARVITDARFQASSIFSLLAWVVIVVAHIIARHYYKPRSFPWKIPISLFIILIRIAFNIGSAFEYSFSQLRYQATPAYIYCLGYLPVILVLFVILYSGWKDPNEDQELLRLRTTRNTILDQEMSVMPERKSTGKHGTERKSYTDRPRRDSRVPVPDYWGDDGLREPV